MDGALLVHPDPEPHPRGGPGVLGRVGQALLGEAQDGDAAQGVHAGVVVGIALGLAMDYEVFLLARVREEWRRGGDPVEAVALGLQRTGPVITNAALLMTVVVAGFLTADMVLMLMIGVGLAIAVVVDATVVRAVLLPAVLALLGRAAWWSPAFLRRSRA
ncbi:hypothetical protein Misp01_81650 [Microtetraspora sp. NBRC 13810]|uniref:MMPL family transporter n=1 Tax=Microtetraspora sp. NBRC 13810 TaxID=3030990 RepID=UPI0024A01DC6|nr:MMPL family transporter [Microtetraspora sp. NBRC 13810]GLW13037.1 hypothetical protein Misp01_81650 [Microtetraspora sp. NBRC 13810]